MFGSGGKSPIRYCFYDGRTWSGAYEIPGQASAGAPGVAALQEGAETVVHLLYREHDGTAIWHTRGYAPKSKE